MKLRFTLALSLVILVALIGSCTTLQTSQSVDQPQDESGFQPIDREFRAAWVASVANINWPSRPGLPVDSQKVEARALLDLLVDLNMNAVIFQVRPQADALYPSELEPWSYYLTGEQGKAPEPYYDPLQFWINEAHERGIELHAWLNPYRVHHTTGGDLPPTSIANKYPDWVVELSSGYHWFIPTKKEAQNHTYQVVMDLVKRYDLDGIHFDDYFYPYPSYHDADFPDDADYQQYLSQGGELSKGDWRRKSVNDLMQRIYSGIKSEKKQVKFGLSPFGIWRPGYPASIQGFDQYEGLYADAKLWLNEGWIDYFTPQLYWPINQVPQSYPVLLSWWKGENWKNRHLWPGVSIGRFEGEKRVDEVLNKVMINRAFLDDSPGMVHWSIQPLVEDSALVEALKMGPYEYPAIIPESPWLDTQKPKAPIDLGISRDRDDIILSWRGDASEEIFNYVVYAKYGNSTYHWVLPSTKLSHSIPLKALPKAYGAEEALPLKSVGVSAVSRSGVESEISRLSIAL